MKQDVWQSFNKNKRLFSVVIKHKIMFDFDINWLLENRFKQIVNSNVFVYIFS